MTEQIKASMVEKHGALHILLNLSKPFKQSLTSMVSEKLQPQFLTLIHLIARCSRNVLPIASSTNRLGAKNSITPTPQHFEIAMNLFKYIQQFINSYPSRVNPSRCLPFTRRRSFDRIFKRHGKLFRGHKNNGAFVL